MHKVPPEAEIRALTGHQFPGGHYTIEHWENVLLTGCTGADLLPGGLAHPAALFHLPIVGSGTSIAEMFALGQAESDLSIMIESYEWEFFQPLQEEREYGEEGYIASAERHDDSEREYDRIQFAFDVSAQDRAVARSTVTWHYTRNTL
ncbi:hypothetical protein BST95_16685 [Halioglobus japonicus]|uniref:Uncharacterized protein n=1 Tax=Halioglobus japonicus TaxID=930805 RepID=A0AAP8SPL9_9GAMM|nr:hypothetical protein [Halioglobus japonicus]AQA19628.1 hypothetical protein BST95_16685 [Halioglobus japonicus]PLW87303.1 hypothetical protein C0029_01525 [Halioglobus japonicus]GHD09113.1 hypothetical protein GCM10007052_06940 [Halioglobus japonicus]